MASAKDVLKQIKDEEIEWVDVRFTDSKGAWHHLTMCSNVIGEDELEDGLMFDGSSIEGWKAINESDMILKPDLDAVYIDPFSATPMMILVCDIVEPSTGELYSRDPRSTAKRAEAFVKSSGAAALDEALGEMMRSGRIREIYSKWKLWNVDQFELASADRPAEAAGLRTESERSAISDSATAVQKWPFSAYAPLLFKAAGITVLLSCLSMAVAMVIGLVVAVCRLYGPAPVRLLALCYVEFFRGTPLLLLLTFLYFGWAHVPYIGVDLSAWQAAIIGFGLNYAAFEAEIYRSSILAVPRWQWEAAQALGMTEVTAFRRVIFPQAFRTALGPMTNDFVAMCKYTSVVNAGPVVELTQQYQILARSSLQFVEIGALTAALYLAMSVPLGHLARYLEERWSVGHK